MSVYRFPMERVQRRCCASCAALLPKLAPTWHRHCRQCWSHIQHYHIVRRIVAEGRR